MKLAPLIALTTAGIIFAGCSNQAPQAQPIRQEKPESSPVAVGNPESPTYTLAEIATHTTPDDCWMVIEGTVYDVSNFGSRHPGGDAIYEGCGIDATTLFNTRPSGSQTPHSNNARNLLPQYAIGTLSQE